jgi:hypothetical protein
MRRIEEAEAAVSSPPLRYRRLWQGLGWAMVATVVWLSLTPHPPEPPSFLAWDKAQHTLAYAGLMFWFRIAFARHWRWPVFMLTLGLGLEVLQGLGGVRTADWHDMVANGLGVIAGFGMAGTRVGRVLKGIDKWLAGSYQQLAISIKERQKFSLGKRSRYPVIFLVTVAALFMGIVLFVPANKQPDLYVPAVAAAASFAYFLYSQHLQETRLFFDLFRQFNERYDSLNEDLNRIFNESNSAFLTAQDRQILFDYFNLCGEEFLYYDSGFIDPKVWGSWRNGMQHFAKAPHIQELWREELSNGSYYGFKIEAIMGVQDNPI